MEYINDGKEKYVNMISFRPFRPTKTPLALLEDFENARKNFSLSEWIDALVASMGYNPGAFEGEDDEKTLQQKLEFCSRFLIAVEPNVNIIELGGKGTGKSFCYNNNSKYLWLHANGSMTRASMFYNLSTRQYGPLKTYDGLGIDEVTTFDIKDNDVRSMMKSYLEAGKAAIGKVSFTSSCGICLLGNINLSEKMLPFGTDYYRYLPGIFQESALMDRFHGFIQGWRIPRLSAGSIYRGWAINMESLSEIMHALRTCPEYGKLFDELVSFDGTADLRDVKAVKKLATAYTKLLFPHVKTLDRLSTEEKQQFIQDYEKYCLLPAIQKRGIIRLQCHLLDKEYQPDMPSFYISSPEAETGRNINTQGQEGANESYSNSAVDILSDTPENKIYVHCLFLSEGEFKDGEKEHRMRLIEEAEQRIKQQAALYGKKLDFINGATGLEGEAVQADTPKDIDCEDCSGTDANHYLALAEEHLDVDKLIQLKNELNCDKAALLVMVDAEGRSFSGCNGKEEEFMGTAIIYGDEHLELQSGVVMHEFLHLFRAKDLYPPFETEDNVRFIQENHPDEVMYQDHKPAGKLVISPLTAWRIGWSDKKEPWFDKFIPTDER